MIRVDRTQGGMSFGKTRIELECFQRSLTRAVEKLARRRIHEPAPVQRRLRDPRPRFRKLRICCKRALIESDRSFGIAFSKADAPQVELVRVQVPRRPVGESDLIRLREHCRERAGNFAGDPVLNREDVRISIIELSRPERRAVRCSQQARSDPDAIAAVMDDSVENGLDIELARRRERVIIQLAVCPDRGSRTDLESGYVAQAGDERVRHADFQRLVPLRRDDRLEWKDGKRVDSDARGRDLFAPLLAKQQKRRERKDQKSEDQKGDSAPCTRLPCVRLLHGDRGSRCRSLFEHRFNAAVHDSSNRRGQLISAARDRGDVPLAGGSLAEGLAEAGDLKCETPLIDNRVGPDSAEDRILFDHSPVPHHEQSENVESLGSEADRGPVAPQHPPRAVEDERSKRIREALGFHFEEERPVFYRFRARAGAGPWTRALPVLRRGGPRAAPATQHRCSFLYPESKTF